MDKLRLAFYTDSYLPATDGVVNSILNFKGELERRGHEVYIFSSYKIGVKKPRGKDVILYPGVDFKPYPQYSVALFPYNSVGKLAELKIDVVHAHTPLVMGFAGMIGARLGRYPLVGSYHTMINNPAIINDYYPKNESFKKFASMSMLRYIQFFYRRCNATIVPSHAIEKRLRNFGGVENIRVVPNSIDTRVFNRKANGESIRKRLKIKDREKVVLYLGRLSKEKRIEVMLKAAKTILTHRKDVRFLIGGTGPAENYYKSMAERLGITKNVRFLGYVGGKDLPSMYAAADLLCLPSTFETQGIVSLEAMAIGKPVVGANFLALRELIQNGKNGEKFRPGDYIDCSKKIEKVLNDSSSYIHGALGTAKEFSVEKVTDRLIDVYNLVLSEQ